MSYEGKLNTDKWFPVVLLNGTDLVTPETGVADTDITVTYEAEGASSESAYVPGATNWSESGNGKYWLRLGASEFTANGKFQVSISATGILTHRFVVEVRSFTIEDLFTGSNVATLSLKSVVINNADGQAMSIQGGLNSPGLLVTGDGTANAINIFSGNNGGVGVNIFGDGRGLNVASSNSQGVFIEGGEAGLEISSNGNHPGVLLSGGTNREALYCLGDGPGEGAKFEGGATGNGVTAISGATGGFGALVQAQNGEGMRITGTGDALQLRPGAGNVGLQISGGDYGIDVLAAVDAMTLTATSGRGLLVNGGSSQAAIDVYPNSGQPGILLDGGTYGIRITGQTSAAISAEISSASNNAVEFINNAASGSGLFAQGATGCALIGTVSPGLEAIGGASTDIGATELSTIISRIGNPADLDGSGATLSGNTSDIFDNLGGGGSFWSIAEQEQIRSALGVDGDKTAATGGQLQDKANASYVKDISYNKTVTNRHSNGKPQTVNVGTAGNQFTVTTTLDGDNVNTEVAS